MTARNRRASFAIAIATAIVSGIVVGAIVLLPRPSVELRVADVSMVQDVPRAGMTDIHLHFVLRNVGSSQAYFASLTLFATDPTQGTLFDTFSHPEVRLDPGETRTFSEATSVTGHWSEVALTVKVFPSDGPSWERSLAPDQPQTWTP